MNYIVIASKGMPVSEMEDYSKYDRLMEQVDDLKKEYYKKNK